MPDLITRYYIGLLPDGLHISMKAGPDPAEKFANVGEHEPLDMDGYRLYPVDEAVWREWTADDEDEERERLAALAYDASLGREPDDLDLGRP